MKFIKINNLVNTFGQCDYKGLNIDQFIAGSQKYKKDMTICVIATNEVTIPQNADLTILTEQAYIAESQIIENEHNAEVITIEQQIADLNQAMAAILGGTV